MSIWEISEHKGGALTPRLDKRLSMVAELIEPNRIFVDVGTDHAYLPAFMVITGYSPFAVASDVRIGPLENARATVRKYGVEDKVQIILSDGLDEIDGDFVQEVVIAGMGGELMCEIIDRAEWLKCKEKALVLQPMTHAEDLRRFLTQNGFSIVKENAVTDGGRAYCAMRAVYSGEVKEHGEAYFYIGELLSGDITEDIELYIKGILKRLKFKADALKDKPEFEGEARRLYMLLDEISGLALKDLP